MVVTTQLKNILSNWIFSRKGRGDIVLLRFHHPNVQGTMLRNAEAAVRDGHRSPGITFAEKSCTRRSTPARRSASNLGSLRKMKNVQKASSSICTKRKASYLGGLLKCEFRYIVLYSTIQTIQLTKPMRSATSLCVFLFYFLLVFLMCFFQRFHTKTPLGFSRCAQQCFFSRFHNLLS